MAKFRDHVRAAVTGNDPARLAKRREIKERLAGLQAIQQRYKAIGQQIQTLNAREDAAVTQHQKTCQPQQERLEQIEAEITQLILAGEQVTDRLADDRAAALEVIAKANSKLEAEVETLKKMRKQASFEQMALAPQIQEINRVRGELTVPGVADPELLTDRFIADQVHVWATARVDAANRALQSLQVSLGVQISERESHAERNSRSEIVRELPPSENERRLQREADYWSAEIYAAEQAQAEAAADKQRIRDAIIAE